MMRLNIFADKRYLPQRIPHCQMLFPFWGVVSKIFDNSLSAERYGDYLSEGADIFEITSLDEAQIAVLPFGWEQITPECLPGRGDLELHGEDAAVTQHIISTARQLAEELAAEAASRNKPLVVFFVDDREDISVSLGGSYTFRPSLLKSRRKPSEFAMPGWTRDEVRESLGGELRLREKSGQPRISFCGMAQNIQPSVRSRLKSVLTSLPGTSPLLSKLGVEADTSLHRRPRERALRILSQSHIVDTDFVFRTRWYNGAFENGFDESLLKKSRDEHLANMLGSDYVLCVRGAGNYSFRFYETLSCGRIPIFVNTDCVLPYEEWIDWKDYCVWVEEDELPQLADKVVEFHERISPRDFQDLQRDCRQLWVDWLSPSGFYKNFHRHFAGCVE